MFELIGGAELWQWDTGRQIDCAGLQAGTKVQFAYSDTQTLSTAVKTADGANVADVPNQLLLRSGALMVYAYVTEADGVSYTKYAARLNVQARPKPDDYVYTPTEVQSWQTIRDEIGDLDDLTTTAKNNLVAAINEAAASGGGGGGSVTKDSIVTALGYTPEDGANRTTALSASSTNTQYPSAKAVWDAIPHPEAKTDDMTQAVGKDANGKLWTAPGGGGGGFAPTLVASLVADGTTTSIMQNIDIVYPAIYTVSIYAKGIADPDNAGQYIYALFGGDGQFDTGATIRSIKTVNNTYANQMVALTFALDAEKKIRTIGKAENQADNLTNWDNYVEGSIPESNAILMYSSTNKIIPAGFKCDVWRWM